MEVLVKEAQDFNLNFIKVIFLVLLGKGLLISPTFGEESIRLVRIEPLFQSHYRPYYYYPI
ncbi:MAG: hypothetical protein D6785_04235, partial [Planctomycetota bacterium]